ncbi:MAG: glycosyltransferase [Candidatus Pacebacteria bacterium]|nr:glycosyltransferase [Candidatus Paceibacterota bacterium]
MKDLSVIVPLYNEEKVFKTLLDRLLAAISNINFEVILIDDGSTDGTYNLILEASEKDKRIKGIIFSRNFGHQAAVSAGLDIADGELVLIIDGDLQDPPELIPEMIKKINTGYDVIYAVRKNRKENFLKRFAYSFFYKLMGKISKDIELPKDSGDFSLIRKKVVSAMKELGERNRYVRGIRAWVGFKQIAFPYERDRRFAGTSKFSFRKLIKLAYDGIFSFSYFPINFISFLGGFSFIVSIIGIFLVLYFRLFTDRNIPGFASLAIISLFLGGVQLLSIGVLGEYIKRIYDETKRRPNYIIKKTINNDK